MNSENVEVEREEEVKNAMTNEVLTEDAEDKAMKVEDAISDDESLEAQAEEEFNDDLLENYSLSAKEVLALREKLEWLQC